jgi:peptide/nickel transport system permease protein
MRQLGRFLLRRLALLAPLLLIVGFMAFALLRLGGQDPTAMLAGPTATIEEITRLRAEYGLDRPMPVQFAIWAGHVLQGDLGRSWITNRSVTRELLDRAPATLELLLTGVALGALVGIPAGMLAAFRRGRFADGATRALALFGFSIPTYFLALSMLLIFFYVLEVSPPGMGRLSLMLTPPPRITGSYLIDAVLAGDGEAARSALDQLILPVICVAIATAAPVVSQVRAIMLGQLGSDHISYARAQGLSRSRVAGIALRGAATPVVTFIGAEVAGLVGTTSLIEYVFAWGGVGQFGLESIIKGDFAVVQAYVLLLALFSVAVFLVVDILVLLLEPRGALR